MKLAHIASHSINVGDGAIIQGIQNEVQYLVKDPVEFINLEIVDYLNNVEWTAEGLDSLGVDGIIVGGGGTIDGAPGRDLSGLAFHMRAEELTQLSTPICFVGIGHNLFPGRELSRPDRLSTFVDTCKEKGIPFSVRRDGSRKRLSKAIDTSYIDVIPDPGFFIKIDESYKSSAIPDGDYVIINPVFDTPARYGSEQNFEATVDLFAVLVESFAKANFRVVVAPHTATDYLGASYVLSRAEHGTLRRYVSVLEQGHPDNAGKFFAAYKHAKLSVGMRGHSVICSTGLGASTVAFSTHPKVKGYMEEMGLERWVVDGYSSKDFLGDMQTAVNDALNNGDEQQKIIDSQREALREDFRIFLQKFLSKI